MAKHRIPQPGLFDEPVVAAPVVPLSAMERALKVLAVPHAVFLAMSPKAALAYCEKRDLVNAEVAEEEGDLEEAAWLRERAAEYRKEIEEA